MRWVVSAILRSIVFGLVWLGLSAANPAQLPYGIIAAVAATALSMALLPSARPCLRRWPAKIWGTVVLAAWFFQQSVVGGIDVARRAILPTVDIAPAVVAVEVTVAEGPDQQLCYLLMNLLPGSMVQHVKTVNGKPVAEIHTLSLKLAPAEQWDTLQHRVQQALQTTSAAAQETVPRR